MEELRESSSRPKAAFAGRNFFVALRDEMLADVATLNQVLEPFLVRLFRLAARGHWIRERRALRAQGEAHVYSSHIPPVATEGLALVVSSNTEGEIQLELIMELRGVSYTLGHYPEIRSLPHWSSNWSRDGFGTVCTSRRQQTRSRPANPADSISYVKRTGLSSLSARKSGEA